MRRRSYGCCIQTHEYVNTWLLILHFFFYHLECVSELRPKDKDSLLSLLDFDLFPVCYNFSDDLTGYSTLAKLLFLFVWERQLKGCL